MIQKNISKTTIFVFRQKAQQISLSDNPIMAQTNILIKDLTDSLLKKFKLIIIFTENPNQILTENLKIKNNNPKN